MERRSLFKTIFGGKEQHIQTQGTYKLLNNFSANYMTLSNNIYDNNIARECIDVIATHCAKLIPKHIQNYNANVINGDINYLLTVKPNMIMTKYDFIYRIVSMLETDNNAFVFIAKDSDEKITGFYPVLATNYSLYESSSGIPLLEFRFINGKKYILPYPDLIHLRKFYNRNDIYGENNNVLKGAIETAQTSNDGIKNSIKLTNSLRGIIHYENAMLKESDLKKNRDRFVEDYLSMGNNSGIATLDAKAKFEPIDIKPVTLDKNQLDAVNGNIYKYFRISEKILTSNYNYQEWTAFYESVIEPIAIQLSDAFTTKIFEKESIKKGNKIIFTTNRLQYADLSSKISLIKEAGALGLLTKDEAREIIDMTPLGGEEGAKIIQSLNNIDSSIANNYQGGNKDGKSN